MRWERPNATWTQLGASSLLLGMATERIAYRPLVRASTVSLVLASVGFSFVLKGFARVTWSGKGDDIPFLPIWRFPPLQVAGLIIVPQNLVILGDALASWRCSGHSSATRSSGR